MQNRNVLGKYRETGEGDPELPPPPLTLPQQDRKSVV